MPASAIMLNARLQAAAERHWRNNPHLHVAELWHRSGEYKLAVTVTPWTDTDGPPEPVPQLPYLLLRSEALLTSVRVIMTAPLVSSEWFWVAARFHWRNGIEHNYTK